MSKLKDLINRMKRERKGQYSHASLWDFCRELPYEDGKWLWRTMMSLEGAYLLCGCLVGILFGLIIEGVFC